MEGDLQQLRSNNRNLTEEKEQIQEEISQIEQHCSSLASDNNQLKENYTVLTNYNNHLQKNYSITAKQKDVLQKNYKAVLDKSHHLTSYCDTNEIQKPCRPCPQDWEPFNSNCYFISMEQKSWKDSRIECLKLGADLVIMESKEEQGFFNGKNDNHWIGLTYVEKKGWIWLDGRSLTGCEEYRHSPVTDQVPFI
nr:CD209 antigen-like [Paramormyrops kingsleyae]